MQALDDEIQQVCFDTQPNDFDEYEEGRTTPYLLLGINGEFPGPPTVEWHDGTDYSGGEGIENVVRNKDKIALLAAHTVEFEITFRIGKKKLRELDAYLDRIMQRQLMHDQRRHGAARNEIAEQGLERDAGPAP